MNILKQLWADELGAVLSAEMVAVSTITVVGVTAGLSAVAKGVNEELLETAHAIRSLNQSYSVPGFRSCNAYSAGSCYTQPAVAKSLAGITLEEEVIVPKKTDEPSEKPMLKQKKKKKNDKSRDDEEPATPASDKSEPEA